MKKISLCIICGVFFLVLLNCQEHSYSPWGIWNDYPIEKATGYPTGKAVRLVDSKKYYDTGHGAVSIVQDCSEAVAGNYHFPAFAVPGEYNKIEKYEKTDYGFLFSMIGQGTRNKPSGGIPDFNNNTRIQIKMIFISSDECRFEYISNVDENGYGLSFLPDEGVIYRRYRVEE
jgi:hypothetical protein